MNFPCFVPSKMPQVAPGKACRLAITCLAICSPCYAKSILHHKKQNLATQDSWQLHGEAYSMDSRYNGAESHDL